MRSLVIGGNRSGKSARGEQLAQAVAGSAPVLFVAPGLRSESDSEFAARVAAHQARRPSHWETAETRDVASLLRSTSAEVVLVDDISSWLTATIDSSLGWTGDRDVANADIDELIEAIQAFSGTLIMVSAEVGMGVLPATTTGRQFADILGALNTRLAEVCERSEFVVAGTVIALNGAGADTVTAPPATTAGLAPATPAVLQEAEVDVIKQQQQPQTERTGATIAGAAGAGVAAAAASTTVAAADTVPEAPAEPDSDETATQAGSDEEFAGLQASHDFEAPEKFPRISSPNREIHSQAYAQHQELTKPAGSLGRLEELSVWYASCRGEVPPPAIADVRVVVFAGDHGVAAHGVSAYPQDVTVQMVGNILAGGAAVNVLARQAGAQVRVVDMAVAGDTPEQVRGHKVRRSSGSIDREDALTVDETRAAIAAGRALADEAVDAGADVLIAGDLGIGNTTPAAVLTAAICGLEPVVAVGRGTGVDDNGWMRKVAAVRDALFRARDVTRKPVALLQRVGGADFAAMAGFLAQAAVRKTPAILDGAVVTAAALVADELAPGARNWWQAGHRSVEPGHVEALNYLGLEPLLDHSMRLGEGSGAVAALPLLQSSVAILREMATFADAGVSTKATAPTTD